MSDESCACLTVKYVTQHEEHGAVSGRWLCVLCNSQFVPMAALKAERAKVARLRRRERAMSRPRFGVSAKAYSCTPSDVPGAASDKVILDERNRFKAALVDIAGRFSDDSQHLKWAKNNPCDCVVCVAKRALNLGLP